MHEPGDHTGPLTAELAEFASGLRFDSIPPATIEHAKLSILDAIGCALFGATLPWIEKLRDVVLSEGGHPQATLWGSATRVSSAQAALVNATAVHAFEFDDVHMGGMIHPGALALGAGLAAGEPRALDGAQLLTAFVAGCEVGARVGRSVGIQHFRVGHHPQGTVGVFAAAAAAGRALGLEPAQLHDALGLAGSQASGLMAAQEGSMAKRLHSGLACQAGVRSARLAEVGFTGIRDVFEAEFGGFLSTMGGGNVHEGALTSGLGTTWETDQIGFKPFASCAAAQSSIAAARELRAALAAGGVIPEAVLVRTSTHTQLHCGWAYRPTGVTAAQMSIPYGVACMLLYGDASVARFTDEAIRDAATVRLAREVTVLGDEGIDALGPDHRYVVHVEARTAEGRTFACDVADRPGGPTQPMTRDEVTAKFDSLVAPILGAQRTSGLRRCVDGLEGLDDARKLARDMARDAPP